MKPYPHHYHVDASAAAEGTVVLASGVLPALETAPPEQFDGPGDRWSPETLLVGAVADCFVLTFRAIARASGLAWTRLRASASGTLERAEDGPRFTAIELDAVLSLPAGVDEARAQRLLEKAEHGCLVSRSLALRCTLRTKIERDGE
jgi:organic hydroperoxide reductase OsmC/OhrA